MSLNFFRKARTLSKQLYRNSKKAPKDQNILLIVDYLQQKNLRLITRLIQSDIIRNVLLKKKEKYLKNSMDQI